MSYFLEVVGEGGADSCIRLRQHLTNPFAAARGYYRRCGLLPNYFEYLFSFNVIRALVVEATGLRQPF